MFPAPFPKTVSRRTPPPLRIFALCLAASAALFAGCKNAADGSEYYADVTYADFEGTWSFTGAYGTDAYTINNDNSTMNYDDDYGFGFSADIIHCYRFVVFNAKSGINDTYGVFIIEFTSPSEKADKYSAVYYRNKTAASVEMATAYNADNTKLLYDTEKKAVSAFVSVSAIKNYVSMWGFYDKQ